MYFNILNNDLYFLYLHNFFQNKGDNNMSEQPLYVNDALLFLFLLCHIATEDGYFIMKHSVLS